MTRLIALGLLIACGLATPTRAQVTPEIDRVMTEVAKQVQMVLKQKDQTTIAIGSFIDWQHNRIPASSGMGAALIKAFEQLKVLIHRESALTLRCSVAEDADQGRLVLTFEVVTKKGKVVSTGEQITPRDLIEPSSAAVVLGRSGALPTNRSPAEKSDHVKEMINNPTPPEVSAHEATVAHGNGTLRLGFLTHPDAKQANPDLTGYSPRPLVIQGNRAVAEVGLNQAYALVLKNATGRDVLAAVLIDGLPLFTFADKKPTHLHIPDGKTVSIPGWPITFEKSKAFETTDFPNTAAAQLLPKPEGVGTVTVIFVAAIEDDSEAGSRTIGTGGDGIEIEVGYVPVKFRAGDPIATLSVQYGGN